ncbi:MAG: 5'/3'-nucleotidase SurE [Hymenobacteraceae bacterium]|nr:5'/3'-nucleotidase SurE [Hymenobacteraceae bacterium]
MARPLILVSNDDGITAPGILQLVSIARRVGQVVVVAPNSPQSGKGHAITIGDPLRLDHSTVFQDEAPDEVEAYECSGTPADCVKLAKHHVLRGRRPDLVISGINHGSNSSISVLYSGTMSAAIEAAIEGLPAIGFSLGEYGHDADFSHLGEIVEQVIRLALDRGLPPGVALNVNLPKHRPGEPIRGLKVCRQARAKWQEEFEERRDPYQRRYFWMSGQFVNFDDGADTDEWALANNYASVVPCQFDLTSAAGCDFLRERWPVNTEPLPPAPAPAIIDHPTEGLG